MKLPSRRVGTPEIGLREWVLLDGNRLVIAGGLLVLVFGALGVRPVAAVLAEVDSAPMTRLFSGFVAGNLTLITVVLSINQLVLSQELRSPRETDQEVNAALEYHSDVASTTGRHLTTASMTEFLHGLLRSADETVDELEARAEAVDDAELRTEVLDLAADLDVQLERMDRLTESDLGLFASLSIILRHDFATELGRCQRIRDEERSSEGLADVLSDIQTHIVQFDVARQYIKTVYMQVELASFSRILLYIGFTAEVITVVALVLVGDPAVSTLSTLQVRAVLTCAFAPLATLFAYVLRVATVAERTAAITPFSSPA